MAKIADRQAREFDIVLWGATGFTGSLVAEYLAERAGAEKLSWALAGRSRDKLEALRDTLAQSSGRGSDKGSGTGPEPAAGEGAMAVLPLIVADSHDPEALAVLAARTRVILTTVGPYALYGSELVAACVAAGTDYCDLSGEPQWMRRMIDRHQAEAEASGARIVHCCGFDSIPSDLGVHFLQQAARERFGAYCGRIGLRVKAARGGMSGGTIASMLNLVEQARADREVARIVKSPYALNPPESRDGPRQTTHAMPTRDRDLDGWLAPFIMEAVNSRVVHRSNALLGFPYGKDFLYDEAMLMGRGLSGRLKATAIALGLGTFAAAAAVGPSRALMKKLVLPSPGEGPSRDEREAGFFNIILVGHGPDGARIKVRVTGDRDPGYGSTSKMIAESALCLARDLCGDGGQSVESAAGGFWTPASALGDALLARLEAQAGLSFSIISD